MVAGEDEWRDCECIVAHLEHHIVVASAGNLLALDELRACAHVRKLREVVLEAGRALDGRAVLPVPATWHQGR